MQYYSNNLTSNILKFGEKTAYTEKNMANTKTGPFSVTTPYRTLSTYLKSEKLLENVWLTCLSLQFQEKLSV